MAFNRLRSTSPAARINSMRSLAGLFLSAITPSAWPSATSSPRRTRRANGGLSSCRSCLANASGRRGSACPSMALLNPAINLSRWAFVGAAASRRAQPARSSCRPRSASRRMRRSRICCSTIGWRKNFLSSNSASTAARSFSEWRSSTHQHCSGMNGSARSSVRCSSSAASGSP